MQPIWVSESGVGTMSENNLYHYRAVYRSNYDGDTLRLDIDLGMGVWLHNQSVRLYGIDTPELRSRDRAEKERAIKARDFVRELLFVDDELIIQTHKDKTGKFGRLLVTVFVIDSGENLNKLLVKQGLAKQANY
jgi:micrococcal nuclease